MSRSTTIVVASFAVAVGLAGCGSSGSSPTAATHKASVTVSSSAPAASSSAMSSSASTPASRSESAGKSSVSSMSSAGQKYTALAVQIDADLKAFLSLPNSTRAATAKKAAGKVAADETTLVRKLKSERWPASAKSQIAVLASAGQREQAVYAKCARAGSVNKIKAILTANKSVIATRIVAAKKARTALQLPVQ